MELKRHLHELLDLLAPDLRRRESHTGERILHGGGERRIAGAEDLERATFVAAALIHYELREHLALYARILERAWVFRSLAADLHDRLLDLELHVWAMVRETSQLADIAVLARAALHTFVRTTGDSFPAEVVLIGDRLGQVDRRQVGRNVDHGRHELEPLRWRRSDFLRQCGQGYDLWGGRLWLGRFLWGLLLWRGGVILLFLHEAHLRLPRLLGLPDACPGGRKDREKEDGQVQYYAEYGPPRGPFLILWF